MRLEEVGGHCTQPGDKGRNVFVFGKATVHNTRYERFTFLLSLGKDCCCDGRAHSWSSVGLPLDHPRMRTNFDIDENTPSFGAAPGGNLQYERKSTGLSCTVRVLGRLFSFDISFLFSFCSFILSTFSSLLSAESDLTTTGRFATASLYAGKTVTNK